MDLKTFIGDGIDCIVRVTYWEPYVPAKISGPPEACYPEEGGWGDWELLDPDGQPLADDLASEITDDDTERITELINQRIEDERHQPPDRDDHPGYTY